MNTHLALLALSALLPGAADALELPTQIESITHRSALCVSPPSNVNCEVSAVARIGEQWVLANDKPVPSSGGAAVFTVATQGSRINGKPVYLPGEALHSADKYEALTTTLDGRYVIASTAFNKEGSDSDPRADVLNTLLYWPVNAPAQARVIEPSTRGGVTSSRGLRERISKAIGAPYFQIEALTTAPGNRLLVGIRKFGNSSRDSKFGFLLLSVPFVEKAGEFSLGDKMEIVTHLAPTVEGHVLGLSGIEFDRFHQDRFYAVTSFEEGEVIGGYLWVVPFTEGELGEPKQVMRPDGSPLRFSNKPEGVEVLDEQTVVVVHDDDRIKVQTTENGKQRGDSEFVYSVITFPKASGKRAQE